MTLTLIYMASGHSTQIEERIWHSLQVGLKQIFVLSPYERFSEISRYIEKGLILQHLRVSTSVTHN